MLDKATLQARREAVGRVLRKIRGDRSRRGIAAAAGCVPQSIKDYEAGRRTPAIYLLGDLARALGVTAAELAELLDAEIGRAAIGAAAQARPADGPKPPSRGPRKKIYRKSSD